MWLFALFLAVPLIEIALFIVVGGWLTLWPTLGLVVLSGIAGLTLIRWQAERVVPTLRRDMGAMKDPLSPLAHGGLIFLGGVLLVVPGFFSDALGLALMLPIVRTAVIHWIGRRVTVQAFPMRQGPQRHEARADGGPVIDGEFIELDPTDPSQPPRGPSGWTRH